MLSFMSVLKANLQSTVKRYKLMFCCRHGFTMFGQSLASARQEVICLPVLHLKKPTLYISSLCFPQQFWTTKQQTASTAVIYFSLTHSQEERKQSDAGLLMFMLATCQSGGELSGSGSVNWALIRCCSN